MHVVGGRVGVVATGGGGPLVFKAVVTRCERSAASVQQQRSHQRLGQSVEHSDIPRHGEAFKGLLASLPACLPGCPSADLLAAYLPAWWPTCLLGPREKI
ncbi:hypothetical protein E2C01_035557 [Portunus trituberculatus]|uniref:Uncharacterized protein n=1 Tax=Portunus trituberculatus TaxID=210409 RepID=A0A5B7F9H1_PORTR|nr:hypothetical protein [Portunus trituberculatus]